MLGLVEVVPDLVHFLDGSRVFDLPLFVVLLSEELDFDRIKVLSFSLEPFLSNLDHLVGFFKGGSSLFSLVLELRVKLVVDHESLVNGQVGSGVHQVAHPLVHVAELRDLHSLQDQLLQVVQLCAQFVVVFCHFDGGPFYFFALSCYVLVDALVLGVERIEVIVELLGKVRGFAEDLTCQGFNLLGLFRTRF